MAYTLTPKCPTPPPDPNQSAAEAAFEKAECKLKTLLSTKDSF